MQTRKNRKRDQNTVTVKKGGELTLRLQKITQTPYRCDLKFTEELQFTDQPTKGL